MGTATFGETGGVVDGDAGETLVGWSGCCGGPPNCRELAPNPRVPGHHSSWRR